MALISLPCLGCCSFGCRCCHAGNSSEVTLAFEDDQVIPPFSREETDDTDNTDDTYDTEDTVYTYDTEDTDQTYDTE